MDRLVDRYIHAVSVSIISCRGSRGVGKGMLLRMRGYPIVGNGAYGNGNLKEQRKVRVISI